MSVLQIGEVNAKKKKKAKKQKGKVKTKYKTNTVTKYKYRNKAAKKKTYKKRTRPKGASLNPVGGDIVKTLKDVGIMAIGGIAAYVGADYAASKVEYIAERPDIGKPAVMGAAGFLTAGALRGKNKALGTKLGYGMLTIGFIYLVTPWLADKIPGLPVGVSAAAPGLPVVSGYYRSGSLGTYLQDSRYNTSMGRMPRQRRYTADVSGYYGEDVITQPREMGAIPAGGGYQ